MDESQYLDERIEDQISWYDKKSQWNQKWFRRLKISEVAAAASIPFLVGYIEVHGGIKLAVGALGVLIAIISSGIALYKFHENWIEYRTTSESLKHEKFLYLTNCPPYEGEDKFCLFVERIESLISKENTAWAQISKQVEAGSVGNS